MIGACAAIVLFAGHIAMAQSNTSGNGVPLFMNKTMNSGSNQKTSPFLFGSSEKNTKYKSVEQIAKETNESTASAADAAAAKRHEKLMKNIENRRLAREAYNQKRTEEVAREQSAASGSGATTVPGTTAPATEQAAPVMRYEPAEQKQSGSRPPRLFNMPD